MQTLKQTLITDLRYVGVDVDTLVLELRDYHKLYNGMYTFASCKAVVYIYSDKDKTRLKSYANILETAIHEGSHHAMNIDPNITVFKNQIHTQYFWDLYNGYMKIADRNCLSRKKVISKNEVFIGFDYKIRRPFCR